MYGKRQLKKSFQASSKFHFRILAVILCLVVTISLPASRASQNSVRNLETGLNSTLLNVPLAGKNDLSASEPYEEVTYETGVSSAKVEVGGKAREYFVLQIEYHDPAARRARFTDSRISKVKGATVLTVIDRFADVFVVSPRGCDLPQIKNDRSVVRCEFARNVTAPPPPRSNLAPFQRKGIPEEIVRNGFTERSGIRLTGNGVYLAIPDTGIDFMHPDFVEYDAYRIPSSRLRFLWDTTLEFRPGRGSKAPFSYPNGSSIGTMFSQDQLTTEIRAVGQGAAPTIPRMDDDGHGTACAGIAAGNGNADKGGTGLKRSEVVGVAPASTIIGIRIGKTGRSLTNAYLLNAIYEWLDRIAGDQPLVISSSFGGHYTGHDGQSVGERELSARLSQGESKGRVIVVAAGNDRRNSIHARVKFGDRDSAQLVSWKAEKEGPINVFFDSSSPRDIHIVRLAGVNRAIPKMRLNRITAQVEATLWALPGDGQIRLFNTSGRQTEAHLYFPNADAGRFKTGVDVGYLVSSPGTAESVITVGSYEWNDNFSYEGKPSILPSACKNENNKAVPIETGRLSCYSSPGPTRDYRAKPDIVAPGEWFTASYSTNSPDRWTSDSTGMYVAMSGTSAATPYTAGVIALLFEKFPGLTTNQIKDLLRQNSTKKGLRPFLGEVPNSNWGNGKLDFDSVQRMFASVSELDSSVKVKAEKQR